MRGRSGIDRRMAAGMIALTWVVVPCSAWAQSSFAGPDYYEAGPLQVGIAIGDFDGDGDGDLAVLNRERHLHVLLNRGDGTFDGPIAHPELLPDTASAIVSGDVDRDGLDDLVVAYFTLYGALAIFPSQGDGSFGPDAAFHDTCYSTQAVTLADLNGDEHLDTASASNCFKASILLNNGDGTFRDNGDYGGGYTPAGIDTGDLDGDRDRDVVYTNGTNDITVLLNDGTGAFGDRANPDVGDNPQDVELVDVDADSDPDAVVSGYYSDDVSVLLNDGSGGFGPPTPYATVEGSEELAMADLDLDGDPDIAVPNRDAAVVSLLHNLGDGSFGLHAQLPAGNEPEGIAVGDLDGDARPDLVVSHRGDSRVAVYRNTTQHLPDADDDGVSDAADCSPFDGTVWAAQTPARALLLHAEGDGTRLSWFASVSAGGSVPRYDVLRGEAPADISTATCVANGLTLRTATDPSLPQALFAYLVRAVNGCGATSGNASDGTPRPVTVACP